ncbi:hypothetical protein DFS33DRAFT_217357 [Desarmillaria ectypa]|nr:hypothetical protein DFS33DRAFT_217357 [Desarmillaria ectypa]
MISRPRRLPFPPSSVYQPSPLLSYPSPTPTTTPTTPVSSSAVLSNALSQPTSFIPQSGSKKSHARRQTPGHIPRPRNAFILFRCDFVRQKRVPPSVERNTRNLSRIAGSLWHNMTPLQQQPWKVLAEQEKLEHAVLYPDYKYQPRGRSRGARQKDRLEGAEEHRGQSLRRKKITVKVEPDDKHPPLIPHSSMDYSLPYRRSSSCPPPDSAPAAPVVRREDQDVPIELVFETRDDLQRRPSCIMMYHSSSFVYPSFGVPSVPMQHEPEELSYSWPVDPRQFGFVTPPLLLGGMGDHDNGFISSEFADTHSQETWIESESADPYLSTEDAMMQWYQEVKIEQREMLFDGFKKDQQQFDTTLFTNPFASHGSANTSSLSLSPTLPSLSPFEIAPSHGVSRIRQQS